MRPPNSESSFGVGIVGFCERTETLDFDGSFAEDRRKNQRFRSEQNKAPRSQNQLKKTENCALTTILKP